MASAFFTPSAVSIWQKNVLRLVRGDEFVDHRARPIAVVRDLQGDAATSVGRVFHRIQRCDELPRPLPTIGNIRPSAPMSIARAM